MKFRTILLTTDLSDAAQAAFPVAESLARLGDGRIILVHVVPELDRAPHGTPLDSPAAAPRIAAKVEAARPGVEAQRQLLAEDLPVEVKVLTGQNAAQAITDLAKSEGVDCILCATHGRSGVRRLVLGSAAEAILRRTTVPVLCVPA